SNSVLRDIDVLTQWLQTARSILAVEMESAGIYTATQGIQRTYPFMAIRGISDIIGAERDNRWTKYACQSAAAFAYAFVTAGIITPHTSTPTTQPAPTQSSTQPTQPSTRAGQTSAEPQNDGPGPIRIFISFAENDRKSKELLDIQLKLSLREGIIAIWHSRQTEIGHDVAQTTKNHIDDAQMVLLLLSPQALADDQIYEHEILYAMKRRAEHNTLVVPIRLKEVNLNTKELKDLGALASLPLLSPPVDQLGNRDLVWYNIAMEILKVAERLRAETYPS
ncbi:MAG TPA: TIR domain-containing protein, partial [Ktedonobacteraceae bacterium]|nr:TIR domain-containing protein [Ktedonobacteraceae bacterium]